MVAENTGQRRKDRQVHAMTTLAIACFDVAYSATAAAVAGVLIHGWEAGAPTKTILQQFDGPPPDYEPGAFYKRELPLLLPVIAQLGDRIDVIVIDGYVWLSADDSRGLGGHLFERLGSRIPVIGVAKTRFRGDTWSVPVLRGTSMRPLFVTAAGIEPEAAAQCIRCMHGAHRIPSVLALVDRAARNALA